jgi:hypothetical protein
MVFWFIVDMVIIEVQNYEHGTWNDFIEGKGRRHHTMT